LRDVAHRRLLIRRIDVKNRRRQSRKSNRGIVRDQGEGLEAGTNVDDTESFDIDADIFTLITSGREEFQETRPLTSAASAAHRNLERGEYGKASKEA
jgi:hypothetical protein